jgi:hypothetical protein
MPLALATTSTVPAPIYVSRISPRDSLVQPVISGAMLKRAVWLMTLLYSQALDGNRQCVLLAQCNQSL